MKNFEVALLETKTMIKRNLWKSLGNRDRIMENIASPILLMLLFVYVLGGTMGQTIEKEYVNYVVPGILLVCIGQCSTSTAISVSTDITEGIVDRFRSMPISSVSVLNGHVYESVIRTTFSLILTYIVSFLFGFQPAANFPATLLAFGVILLFTFTLTWISVLFGLLVKGPDGANSLIMYTQAITFLSSGFIDTKTLPKVLQVFADNQPITPLIETIRRLLFNQPLENYLILSICWCTGLLTLAYLVSMTLYMKKLSK